MASTSAMFAAKSTWRSDVASSRAPRNTGTADANDDNDDGVDGSSCGLGVGVGRTSQRCQRSSQQLGHGGGDGGTTQRRPLRLSSCSEPSAAARPSPPSPSPPGPSPPAPPLQPSLTRLLRASRPADSLEEPCGGAGGGAGGGPRAATCCMRGCRMARSLWRGAKRGRRGGRVKESHARVMARKTFLSSYRAQSTRRRCGVLPGLGRRGR